MTVLDW